MFTLSASFTLAPAQVVHQIPNPISQFFGIEIYTASGDFKPRGKSAPPAFFLDPYFVFVI